MKKFLGGISFYVLLIIAVLSVITLVYMPKEQNKKIYSDLLVEIQKDNVQRLDISDSEVIATLRSDPENQIKVDVYNLALFYQDAGEEFSEKVRNGEIAVEHHIPSTMPAWVSLLAPLVLFGLLMLLYVFVIMPGMQGGGSGGGRGGMPFSKMKARVNIDAQRRVTFDDVAGADEEKEELKEVVEFLKNPKRFVELGARIPKGVLLVGPPGTGKTLLAKAVAGEAEVPFFSISGSDFVELYVGVGASRVRDLFEQAKKNQPCIIFIDEIDAVGRHRGAGMGGGHDEREQTLNQLLVEMDGFGENQGVIVIAATNRPDILDPALLRPGRFDRQVEVGYPDIKGREAILKVHSRKKPLDSDVDLLTIAKTTVGFTGADLENLLNEAALLTARKGRQKIDMESIEKSIIKVIAGPEKSSRVVQERDKKITAYHEAGHAIVSHVLPTQDPVHHVTIIPRGRAAGFTMNLPVQDKGHMTKNEMLEDIVTLLSGRVAEKIIFDDISAGASNDIERATKIANHMVTRYGMSEKLGPISYGGENDEVFLGRDYGHSRSYSESMAAAIDAEVENIISGCYDKSLQILKEHQDKLVSVAEALLEREKLDGEEFVKVFNGESLPEILHSLPKADAPLAAEAIENVAKSPENDSEA